MQLTVAGLDRYVSVMSEGSEGRKICKCVRFSCGVPYRRAAWRISSQTAGRNNRLNNYYVFQLQSFETITVEQAHV